MKLDKKKIKKTSPNQSELTWQTYKPSNKGWAIPPFNFFGVKC